MPSGGHNRKLTAEQVLRIRADPTASCMELAALLGVSHVCIWKARVGQTWKHLDENGRSRYTLAYWCQSHPFAAADEIMRLRAVIGATTNDYDNV